MGHIGETRPHPEWRVIVDLFRALDYGQSLAHRVVCEATSLRAESTEYYRHISQARRVLLRDHGIEVESEPGKGYRRVEPGRYGERSKRDLRLGGKRIRRGRKVLEVAPVHLMTPEQVKEIEHATQRLNLLVAQMTSTIRSMKNVLPPVGPETRKLLELGSGDDTDATTH